MAILLSGLLTLYFYILHNKDLHIIQWVYLVFNISKLIDPPDPPEYMCPVSVRHKTKFDITNLEFEVYW